MLGSLRTAFAAVVFCSLPVAAATAGPASLTAGLAAFQQDPATGLLVVEGEHFDRTVSQGGHEWVPSSEGGASGDGSLVTTPDSETNRNSDYVANSPRLDYAVQFVQAGVYRVWVRGLGPDGRDDSLHVGLDGQANTTADRISGFTTSFGWSNDTMDAAPATLNVPAPGVYDLNVWMREDGFVFDKILLTPDSAFTPTGLGPDESPRGEPAPFLAFDLPSLSFDVEEGTGLSSPLTLSVTASDGGATGVTLESGAGWLDITPAAGTTPLGDISVRVDASGLPAGTYQTELRAVSGGYTDGVVTVAMTVRGDAPPAVETQLEAEDAALGGGAAVKSRYAGFTGTGYVDMRGSSSVEWDFVAPAAGNYALTVRYAIGISDRRISLSVNGAALPSPTVLPSTGKWKIWQEVTVDVALDTGTNRIRLSTTQTKGPNIDHLRIEGTGPGQPDLAFASGGLTFGVEEGSGVSAPQTISLGTSDGTPADVTLTSAQGWLSVSPSSGTTPLAGIEIRVDAGGLSPGTYSADLVASAPGFDSDTLSVDLTVNAAGGEPPPVGDDTIYETESASLSGVVVKTRYPGYTGTGYGEYRGSDSATWTISVPTAGEYVLAFRYAVGIKDRRITVTVDGATVPGVTVMPSTGSWKQWGEVSLTRTLAAGSHAIRLSSTQTRGPNVDHLRVTGGGGGGAALDFDREDLNFTVTAGGDLSDPQSLALTASDGGTPDVTLSADQDWVLIDPTGGAAPLTSIAVRIDPAGLSAGGAQATLRAEAPGYAAASVNISAAVIGGLPVVYDFDDGDASAWTVVAETADAPDWRTEQGRFVQRNSAGGSVSGSDTYLEGTYAYVPLPPDTEDYTLSVDVESLETDKQKRGDGLGLIFRYVDANNFYRLSLNSKFGFTRLERRIAGQTTTLAVTSQGYRPGNTIRLGIRIEGPRILVYREDEGDTSGLFSRAPYLAAHDENLSGGGIALYTRSAAAFDNVRIAPLSGGPRVAVSRPVAYTVLPSGEVGVQAIVQQAPASAAVRFELGGDACGTASASADGVYSAACSDPGVGEHKVTAVLLDGNTEVDRHDLPAVGIGGDKALTIGDSVTNGVSDNFLADGISVPVLVGGVPSGSRQVAFRGYQGPLADGLAGDGAFGAPIVFFNEAVPGDRSDGLLVDRLPSILERHPDGSLALMQIGTNDANANVLQPGTGCSGAACDGTFKGNVRDTVLTLRGAGIEPWIARIPPIFGRVGRSPWADPLADGRPNERVIAYNAVIDEVIAEFSVGDGPDFFGFFLGDGENRLSLIDDNIHPNALGYVLMAWQWQAAISPAGVGPRPLVLEGICVRTTSSSCQNPLLYKQNILETGNPYYIDRDLVLTGIPSFLAEGVFLNTANDDKTVTRSDYLEFTVDRPVDVYVALSRNVTTLPAWMASFSDTGEDLGVSAGEASLNLFRASYAAGTITLGGPRAAGVTPNPSNNYVVIVVPR